MKMPTHVSRQPLIGLLLLALLSLSAQVHAATFNVTERSCDATPGGYEWAIEQANNTQGRDTISINVAEFLVDGCTHPDPGAPFPIAITESVDIVGNGNSVSGNFLFFNKNTGGANTPGRCPGDPNPTNYNWANYGGGLLQIGEFGAGAAGIEVTVTDLHMRLLTNVAFIRENGALTIEDSEIKDAASVWSSCQEPIITAMPGADLTLRRTLIDGASVPTSAIPSTQFPLITGLIVGGDGDLVMDEVSFLDSLGVSAAGIVWTGGTVKVVGSQFDGSSGFWLTDSKMEFVNSAYRVPPFDALFRDNILLGPGATLTTQGSTFYWSAFSCNNCNVTKGSGSSAVRGLGFAALQGVPLGSARFESTALGAVEPSPTAFQQLWADPQVFSSDAYTWVQPTAGQDAAELAAILPSASTATPGLTTVPARGSVTQWTPIIPGALIEAVPDADTGGVNELLNPITGQPITTDVLGNPRVYVNGTRNIGAVQNDDAPLLSATPGDAEVTVNWAPTGPAPDIDYQICVDDAPLPEPLIGDCPGGSSSALPTETSKTITNLTNGSPWWFAIRAIQFTGAGIWSNVVTATPLGQVGVAQPTGVTSGDGSLQVTWAAPTTLGGRPGPVRYSVLYRPSGTQSWLSLPGQTTALTAQLTGLINGTSYEIGILAQTADGALAPLGTTTGTPTAPPTLSYAAPGPWPQNTPLTLTPTVTQLQGAGVYNIAGGALPDGMMLNASTGVISGTPTTAPQSTSATILLVDSNGKLTTATVPLSIVPQPPTPQLWYPSIQATVGTGPVSATPTQSNIPAGATYSVVAGESLPDGFSIDATTGVVSGIPTSAPGRVLDVDIQACWGGCDPNAGEVRVAPMLFYILPGLQYPANTDATAGVAVTITPTVDLWSGGVFSITAGSLPAGMDLNTTTGVISGTPQTVLNAQLTIRYSTGVNVGGLEYVSSSTQISVNAPAIALTYPAATGTVGKDLTVTPTVSGLSGTAVYRLVSGSSLPQGLSLNPATGAITGVPSGPAGSYPVVIQVSDPYGSQRTSVVIELKAMSPTSPTSVPTLSLPALALLAILMTLMGGWARRQYRVRR